MMHAPSDEQRLITTSVATHNVIVDSVAGSGKTTTIMHIAAEYKNSHILVLTYNARLKFETRERAAKLSLNIHVHTYHSFAVKYISPECHVDTEMIKFINSGAYFVCDTYDIIIIDEAQDMNDIYYKLTNKILKNSPNAQLVVIGDKFQSIYNFAGADSRYITMADILYRTNYPWARRSLSTSYRLTRPNAAFVNNILGIERLHSVKDGPKPRYFIYNAFEQASNVLDEIDQLLCSGYLPDDIFVLAPTVRPKKSRDKRKFIVKHPIREIANALSNSKHTKLIYVPTNDDQELNEKVIKHKIVFSSFHQSKGLERKHVIVVGFDSSYARYYNSDDDNRYCSNAMYVALTRATVSMSIYHNCSNEPLDYVNLNRLADLVDIKVLERLNYRSSMIKKENLHRVSVTQLCQHLSAKVLVNCMKHIKTTTIRKGKHIKLVSIAEQTTPAVTYYEEVAAINGTAVTMYCEWIYTNCISIYMRKGVPTKIELPLSKLGRVYIHSPPSIVEILYLANCSLSSRDGVDFKMKQIHKYNWMTNHMFAALIDRITDEINDYDPLFECTMSVSLNFGHINVTINGAADIISRGRLIEIKTVTNVSDEHLIQLALYMFMMKWSGLESKYNIVDYHLYNVRNDELIAITSDMEHLKQVVMVLLCNKLHTRNKSDDAQFLRKLNIATIDTDNICNMCSEVTLSHI